MKMNTISSNMPAIQTTSEQKTDQFTYGQGKHKQVKQSEQDNTKQEVHKHEVKYTVEKLNDFIDPVRTNLKFVLHEDLHEYYVTVVDPLTNEVIKEIPPKKMLDMYAAMTEYMGLLVDEKI
ncbi:MAG TPA: flagellar protein FlaG [Pseudogracilibacillus sp.]|nr:flagellar protein FlaG [Pseudogracilibacillus sp.]